MSIDRIKIVINRQVDHEECRNEVLDETLVGEEYEVNPIATLNNVSGNDKNASIFDPNTDKQREKLIDHT